VGRPGIGALIGAGGAFVLLLGVVATLLNRRGRSER
jgi:hypothetical protein